MGLSQLAGATSVDAHAGGVCGVFVPAGSGNVDAQCCDHPAFYRFTLSPAAHADSHNADRAHGRFCVARLAASTGAVVLCHCVCAVYAGAAIYGCVSAQLYHPLHADRTAAAYNDGRRLRGAPHLQQSALTALAVAESAGAQFLLSQYSSSNATAAVVSIAAAVSRGLRQ